MNTKRGVCVLICLLVMVCLGNVSSPAIFGKESKEELLKENQQLEDLNQEMQKQITEDDKKVAKATKEYEKQKKGLKVLVAKVSRSEKKLKRARASRKNQYVVMNKRIRFLYENGNTAYLEALFEADSIQDFLDRAEYVSKISKYDSTMLTRLQAVEDKIAKISQQLKVQKKKAEVETAKAAKTKKTLEELVASKRAKIVEYQKKVASNQMLIAQYDAEEAAAAGGPNFADQGGNLKGNGMLLWPVPSCHSIISPYGYRIHPVTGVRKLHGGIDIPCGTGSKIVASADGIVMQATYNVYNGNFIKISHGNGMETMYLHCSRLLVSVGDKVKKGQLIAKSGSTGMVTGPHLHFVVKINGQYMNPTRYL